MSRVEGHNDGSVPGLIITADDYGYTPRYDEGILEAARAGAVDSVSAMVDGDGLGPAPLLESGVEVGLHVDLGTPVDASRARPEERRRAAAELERQRERFVELFGRPPAYLDGHHHCHAREGLGVVVSDFAVAHGLPVRSINARHRRLLRCRGVATPDLLVGRLQEREPALPVELDPRRGAGAIAAGDVVEWMVHPGRSDPGSGSSYDAGREEDLELLLAFSAPDGFRRSTHAEAELAP